MPYLKGTQRTWTVTVPTRDGRWVRRSSGTTHRPTAVRIERMLEDLGARRRRAWDLLDAIIDRRLTLGELLDAWDANDLEALRGRLHDVDIEPFVAPFLERHAARVSAGTVNHYRHILRKLIPPGEPFLRSRFSVSALDTFVTNYRKRGAWKRPKPDLLPPIASAPERRKVHAALSQFARHLVRLSVLSDNPLRRVDPPPSNRPRTKWLEIPELQRLVESQPEPYQTLAALLAGTGIELSVALTLRAEDVDLERQEIRARGTKTHSRDRMATVATWAWPFVVARVAQLPPSTGLFAGIARQTAYLVHVRACEALGISDYRVHDHRHSYAVRALRAGTPAELVARQLGHANPAMVTKVYGRFIPSRDDRTRWELVAAKQAEEALEAAKRRATAVDTPTPAPDSKSSATIPATTGISTVARRSSERRPNPKARRRLRRTGAGGLEPPTSALTVRRSAN
jgi:integrase